MKFNTMLKKTALAAAIATVSFGASAAGTLTVATPTVLANEIFGAGSETTTIALPVMTFTSTDITAQPVANVSTVKLTLGNVAIFGDNYDDPAKWAAQGVVVNVGGVTLNGANAKVTAGGTSNDNQVTITITDATAVTNMQNITVSGFKVKNLKTLLERVGEDSVRSTSAVLEVRNNTTSNGPADFATAEAEEVIVAINGVVFASTNTDSNREMLNIMNGQTNFTIAKGALAKSDFGVGQPHVALGTLGVNRGVYKTIKAKKEDGISLFDLTGSDKLTITFSAESELDSYAGAGLYLAKAGTACGAAAQKIAPASIAGQSAVFNLTGNDVTLDQSLAVCVEATGSRIEELKNLTANAEIAKDAKGEGGYYSARYTNSKGGPLEYGSIGASGCSVTLFNLPNVGAKDKGFLRLTNTSAYPGKVSATVWAQNGTKLETETKILDTLAPHATAIFHTNPAQATNLATNQVYLGDSLTGFVAGETGRSRIILQGAFPSCEALGLIRSENGTLVNMTSTVSSTAGAVSAPSNNTSNTQN